MSKKFTYDTDMLGYHVLTNEDLDAIHEATLELMHDYGVQMHGKEALDVLAGAGCEVDYEIDRVRFPKGLVNDAIESTPAEITLCGRDPKNDTVLGGKKVCYKNFGTGVFIFDPYTGELRESTKEDLGNVARFIDAIPEINCFSIAVTAGDVNQKVRSLHEAEVVPVAAHPVASPNDFVEFARVGEVRRHEFVVVALFGMAVDVIQCQ